MSPLRPAIAWLLALAAVPAAALPLKIEPTTFKLADGTLLPVERGTFAVPEDRDDPRSRPIDIGFIRFKSTNPKPGAPIVYLAGGPGSSGVSTARGARQPIFLALRAVADVIALDQRGVGLSNAIEPCAADRKLDPATTLSEASLTAYYRATLDRCLAQWRSAGVAVNGYTTEQSADDIEALRRALGVKKVDLWGISYGTHLALATLRRHPRSIGRAALASLEGLDQTVKLPARVDSALARMERFAPGLDSRMRRVHSAFDARPTTLTVPKGASFRADSFPLRMLAASLPKNPGGIARLAAAYEAIEAGRTDALASLLWAYYFEDRLTLTGMPELMDIASGISGARLAAVRRQAATSIVGTATNFPMPQLRGAVPGLELEDAFRREISSSIPVLLLSGDLDVRTPIEEQSAATAGLTRLHRILVKNGGHDLFEAHPRIPAILVDFFSRRKVAVKELTLPVPK